MLAAQPLSAPRHARRWHRPLLRLHPGGRQLGGLFMADVVPGLIIAAGFMMPVVVIGMLTPPVGVVLFVVCGVTGVSMREMVKNVWPFIALMYGVLLLCMLFPPLVTALPKALGYRYR